MHRPPIVLSTAASDRACSSLDKRREILTPSAKTIAETGPVKTYNSVIIRSIGGTYYACAMASTIAINTRFGMSELRMLVDLDGYAVLSGIAPGRSTDRVAARLGDIMLPWGGELVQELTSRAISTPNTYSGIFGLERFPFHTDLAHWPIPPRYLLLRCIRGYEDVPPPRMTAPIAS